MCGVVHAAAVVDASAGAAALTPTFNERLGRTRRCPATRHKTIVPTDSAWTLASLRGASSLSFLSWRLAAAVDCCHRTNQIDLALNHDHIVFDPLKVLLTQFDPLLPISRVT